jgi:hypothetical protein
MQILECDGCGWLDNNPDYRDNVKKLIVIQKWIKRIILSNRLSGLIPGLVPIYYHPDHRGGFFHKKRIMAFIQGIEERNARSMA